MTGDAGRLVQLGDVLDREGAVDVGRLVRVSVADAARLIAEGRAVPVADRDASPTADGRGGAAAVDDRAAGVYPLRFFRALAAQGPRGRVPRGCAGLGDSGPVSEKSPGDCRSGVPEGSRRG